MTPLFSVTQGTYRSTSPMPRPPCHLAEKEPDLDNR